LITSGIIIIIINEKIIVAFSPRTTRTRYKVKKTKPRDTSCLAVQYRKAVSHGYDRSNNSVLSCCLNVSSDDCDVRVASRLFHTPAPATGKARSPRVRRRVVGTSSAGEAPERSRRRDLSSAAQLKDSAR